eukprot:TRINITY_DN767_c0_g1_i6.p1 TRINITY_DN767_c0_g1~~TRINITY_DN767_c0_g1_i6.p1  ORF type:complete len:281 (+),score=24.35 TRINITY_DN767_c0_g1_i6:70-912(+)
MAIALPSIAASLHSQHRTTRPLSAASVGQQGSAATDSRRSTCLPPLQRPLLLPVTLDSWTPHFCPTIAKYRSQRISARCSPTSIVVVASAKMEDDGFEDGQDGSLNPQTMKARTLELVETSMLAGLSGLVFFLASSLRLENQLGFFFPLPVVIACLRWGVGTGINTLTTTAVLLLILSGPLKSLTYMLLHGFVGITLGAIWSSGRGWRFSLPVCTGVRAAGGMGFLFLSSFLLKENILRLILVNAHSSISQLFAAMGSPFIPPMSLNFCIFISLVTYNPS